MRHLAVCLVLWPQLGSAEQTDVRPSVISAELVFPTDRYDHAILGDNLEWAGLRMIVDTCPGCDAARTESVVIRLPPDRVFEDLEARVADLDLDGYPEVMVVETDLRRGASLAIYDASGKRAATDFIGQKHRWLAPAGWGDFDGDGFVEIAYVDRPHFRRELVVMRYANGEMTEIDRAAEFTNHRIGDTTISGGIRHCGGKDSLILASGDWAGIAEITIVDDVIHSRPVPGVPDEATLRNAMTCTK